MHPTQSKLDFTGAQLKDAGMQLVAENTERKEPGWHELVIAKAREYLKTFGKGYEFQAEQLRNFCEAHNIPEPSHKRAYGGIMATLARMELIVWTGRFKEVDNPKAHSATSKIWRVL